VNACYTKDVKIAELHVCLIEGAIKYAELNNDPESVALGQNLLAQQTSVLSAAIADLDPNHATEIQ
jgi:hypothetical protein